MLSVDVTFIVEENLGHFVLFVFEYSHTITLMRAVGWKDMGGRGVMGHLYHSLYAGCA